MDTEKLREGCEVFSFFAQARKWKFTVSQHAGRAAGILDREIAAAETRPLLASGYLRNVI